MESVESQIVAVHVIWPGKHMQMRAINSSAAQLDLSALQRYKIASNIGNADYMLISTDDDTETLCIIQPRKRTRQTTYKYAATSL